MSGFIHINWTHHSAKSVTRDYCPDCKTQTRFMGFFQEWYGWTETCLRCGRKFADGEWMPLDFVRGVRASNIKQIKAHWRKTPKAKIVRRVKSPNPSTHPHRDNKERDRG